MWYEYKNEFLALRGRCSWFQHHATRLAVVTAAEEGARPCLKEHPRRQ